MVTMGTICPTCQKHKAYKSVQTVDGNPPKNATDILFYRLECDHIWGVGHIKEYMKRVNDIRKKMAEEIQNVQEQGRMKMVSAYKELEATKEGGRK